MSRDANTRPRRDEDTQVFLGHMTNQANDEPEQQPNDQNRRQPGPEKSPNQQSDQRRRKDDKRNRDNRK